jgi:hypothetical protein
MGVQGSVWDCLATIFPRISHSILVLSGILIAQASQRFPDFPTVSLKFP